MSLRVPHSVARWICPFVLVLVPRLGNGQELAVFELNDYVDPRLLGAELVQDEVRDISFERGLRFLSVRTLLGGISDYQQRGVFSKTEFLFAHASLQYYSGRNQLGLSYSKFDVDPSDFSDRGLPGLELGPTGGVAPRRLRLNYGWYDLHIDDDGDDKGEVDSARREVWLLTEEPENGLRAYELGAGVSIGDEIHHKLRGSLLFVWKSIEKQDDEYRISYLFEDELWTGRRGRRILLRAGYTAERTFSHWRWGSTRYETSLLVPFDKARRTTLHLVAAPSYRFRSRGIPAEWNWELSFFVSTSALEILY